MRPIQIEYLHMPFVWNIHSYYSCKQSNLFCPRWSVRATCVRQGMGVHGSHVSVPRYQANTSGHPVKLWTITKQSGIGEERDYNEYIQFAHTITMIMNSKIPRKICIENVNGKNDNNARLDSFSSSRTNYYSYTAYKLSVTPFSMNPCVRVLASEQSSRM